MKRPAQRTIGSLLGLVLILGCADEQVSEEAVAARIDGEPLLLSEVERGIAWPLYRARVDAHVLLERETQRLIEERILGRVAREQGVDPETLLLRAEGVAEKVTDSDIDRYLEEHENDVSIDQARPRIRHYLEETRRIEARLAYLEWLRAAADVEILVSPPEKPRVELDVRGAPSRGAPNAPVTILHFADLSAADSARSGRNLARLQEEFPGRIRVLHRSLPVPRDEIGLRAAQLAVAADAAGTFWDLHDRLVEVGGAKRQVDLDAIARDIGLAGRLSTLAADGDTLLHVSRDLDHARRAGVRRAPTLFANGRYFMGLGRYEDLRTIVVEELRDSSESRP